MSTLVLTHGSVEVSNSASIVEVDRCCQVVDSQGIRSDVELQGTSVTSTSLFAKQLIDLLHVMFILRYVTRDCIVQCKHILY